MSNQVAPCGQLANHERDAEQRCGNDAGTRSPPLAVASVDTSDLDGNAADNQQQSVQPQHRRQSEILPVRPRLPHNVSAAERGEQHGRRGQEDPHPELQGEIAQLQGEIAPSPLNRCDPVLVSRLY